MVKTVLCDFCLRSGVLCSVCKERIRSGEVTPTYVKVARLLVDMEKRYGSIGKISLHDVVEAGGTAALLVGRGEISYVLSRGGRIIREIEREIGKDVRILEKGAPDRKFLEDLFAPHQVITTNKIWLPDGSVITGVVIRGHKRLSDRKLEELGAIVRELRGMTLRVRFLP